MVVILAAKYVDVKGHSGSLGERLEDVRDHLGREISNLLPLELQVAAEIWAGGDVEHSARESL